MELGLIVSAHLLVIIYLLVFIVGEFKRKLLSRKLIHLFIDSMHSTMYVSPNKNTTGDELKAIIDKYSDTYKVKIVEPNTRIKGIKTYVVDLTKNRKG
ncbi:hypothetical protein MUA33_05335 [Staphylococcus delphini]|uniref:hypothetical protein n=1 Tax=Staphylococcus delphini TaxID=53344 RepID=UPI0021D3E27D|nr:hypothetical protein [Staphylococcus delphini]UXS30197.1 hypothetical protein MUA33_05335 [Staphylococcus delphini]UXS37870.1 hypothetical protein MUA34_05590 [Staphylococcus delphini]UXS45349.1 hypothetical protein MUA39_05705 [Staphylococcus delphini]UXV45971.1 hypothetical protein MUA63_05675 [Staphylococcus delphini]